MLSELASWYRKVDVKTCLSSFDGLPAILLTYRLADLPVCLLGRSMAQGAIVLTVWTIEGRYSLHVDRRCCARGPIRVLVMVVVVVVAVALSLASTTNSSQRLLPEQPPSR